MACQSLAELVSTRVKYPVSFLLRYDIVSFCFNNCNK